MHVKKLFLIFYLPYFFLPLQPYVHDQCFSNEMSYKDYLLYCTDDKSNMLDLGFYGCINTMMDVGNTYLQIEKMFSVKYNALNMY